MHRSLSYLSVFLLGFGVAWFRRGPDSTSVCPNAIPTNNAAIIQAPSGTQEAKSTDSLNRGTSGAETITPSAQPRPIIQETTRKELLASLLPSEIALWKEMRAEKANAFLKNNDEFWLNDDDRDPQGRFDLRLAREALGVYSGKMDFQIPSLKERLRYDFGLVLNSFDSPKENKLSMKGDTGSQSVNFTYRALGTDSKNRMLNVVWQNSNSNQSPLISAFAFKLPVGMPLGQNAITELFGLDETLKWQKIGTIELGRIR